MNNLRARLWWWDMQARLRGRRKWVLVVSFVMWLAIAFALWMLMRFSTRVITDLWGLKP